MIQSRLLFDLVLLIRFRQIYRHCNVLQQCIRQMQSDGLRLDDGSSFRETQSIQPGDYDYY
jgi:hypothetical protein